MASAVVNIDIRNAEAQQLAKRLGTRRFPPGQKSFRRSFSVKLEHFNAGALLLQLPKGILGRCDSSSLQPLVGPRCSARMLACPTTLRYNPASAWKTSSAAESTPCWRRATPIRLL